MKKHALTVILLGAMVLLAAALAPPGGAGAQPQPTMVLSPASGPCDAVVEVAGKGLPVPSGPFPYAALYLVQPGTANVNAASLTSARVNGDGSFSAWVGLKNGGCEAAALDSQAQRPTDRLVIAATLSDTSVQAGGPIPDIKASAQYEYLTAAAHVTAEALTVSPASGPCDGAVDVTGSGFEPGIEVLLNLARPGSDDALGTLASAVADGNGRFVAGLTLGDLGCRAAQGDTITGDRAHPKLTIWADRAVTPPLPVPLDGYPTPVPVATSSLLAGASYAYTTTEVGGGMPPRALPATGSGPADGPPRAWVPLIGTLAALGVMVVAAFLFRRRARS